jgi:hypothetical protein
VLYRVIKKNKELRATKKDAKKQALQPTGPTGPTLTRMASGPTLGGGSGGAGTGSSSLSAPTLMRASSAPTAPSAVDRRHLHNYRVVQRNLVYVIGLPANLGSEETLRKPEYFGQYGRIGKIVIHKTHSGSGGGSMPTISAYITFVHKDDAKASIQSLEAHWIDNHVLRASFGTTKYCNNFIRGLTCNNPDCVYLHEMGNDEDRFTKAEIQAGHSKLNPVPGQNQLVVTGMGGPSGTGKRPTGEPVLPPPVFLKYVNPAENSSSSSTSTANAPAPVSSAAVGKPALNRSSTWNGNGGVPSALAQGLSSSGHAAEGDGSDDKSQSGGGGDTDADSEKVNLNAGDLEGNNNNKDKDEALGKRVNGVWGMDKGKDVKSSAAPAAVEAPAPAPSKSSSKMLERERLAADKRIAAEKAQALLDRQNSQNNSASGSSSSTNVKASPAIEENGGGGSAVNKDGGSAAMPKDSNPSTGSIADDKQQAPAAAAVKFEEPKLAISASFNGLGHCAVFTVPISSFGQNSIWSSIFATSNTFKQTAEAANLEVNPYSLTRVSVSELFDLTLPPVDAIGLPVWPKPASYYVKLSNQQQQQQQQPFPPSSLNQPQSAPFSGSMAVPHAGGGGGHPTLPPQAPAGVIPGGVSAGARSLQSMFPGARVSSVSSGSAF